MVRDPPNKKAKDVAKIQFDDILDDENYDLESRDIDSNDKPSSLVWWYVNISSHGVGQLEHGVGDVSLNDGATLDHNVDLPSESTWNDLPNFGIPKLAALDSKFMPNLNLALSS